MTAVGLMAPGIASAQAAPSDKVATSDANKDVPTAFNAPEHLPKPSWGTGSARSFLVPAYEIPAFEFLLNRFDHIDDPATYPWQWTNFRRNLHRQWVIDNDKFSTNQFLHPYQGAIYQGLARSAGLDFWQASAYTFGGSLLWEYSGENTAPSINDQVASGIGGNFFGEPLFRLASLLLESGQNESPGWWREWAAALISPPTGFNRLVYGTRFSPVFPSYDPAVFTRVDMGGNVRTTYSSNINVNADPSAPPTPQTLKRGVGTLAFAVGYGLPGKPDYAYERPFDYFNLEIALDTASGLESIFTRGLLYGTDYEVGSRYRGIWGLYGIYDYSAPNIFRVSNTAGAVGTTAQWLLSEQVAVQGTALLGVGYAGGGVIRGSGVTAPSPNGEGLRNYHYGLAPESVVALKFIFGDRVALDTTARGYYISRLASSESTGSETLDRFDVLLTVRVFGLHGLTAHFTRSVRDGRYVHLPDSHQRVSTVSIGYTLLGHQKFGAVDWTPATEAAD